ncbi:MAG: glycosyltransferase [Deltaproteobacteria bacterium]|nr:MAG: glycosyltransferase [Deltaproteobacteria bacterium]
MQTKNGKPNTENGPLLIIFAKEPCPGQVKTRLCPHLSPEAAARLYQCFLEDILEEMGRLPDVSLAVAYAGALTVKPRLSANQYRPPDIALKLFRKLVHPGVMLFTQEGAGLSERLVRAFDWGFAKGFDAVLIRNSDSPDLPGELISAGGRALARGGADLVLGPSPDGGYFLVGMKKSRPQLFQGISWSSAAVLADTLEKARESSLTVHLLPSWPDIDSIADLRAFAANPPLPDAPGRRSYLCARELLRSVISNQ